MCVSRVWRCDSLLKLVLLSACRYYSFDVAGVHFVMLNSYMDYNKTSAQYAWLVSDLASVDRTVTPWIVAAMHAPWYNSNVKHHDEVEEYGMRAAMEDVLNAHHTDLVLAGHVHAYERMYNTYNNVTNASGPVYINIGDAGNREGPCPDYLPQPAWSAYRESAFGHGVLTVSNATHMRWTWHKINNPEAQTGDDVWIVKRTAASALASMTGEGSIAVGIGANSASQFDGSPVAQRI